ncbi:hypothetical protein GCM10022252_19370 [Streptosporangium oxazolinicum]|uniref:Uncharacterized protein n=1 Tax=Streptosporangium oxazolinicum TaxID=909287 RepID=A0ABP8ANB0_9ACTN
MVAVTDEAGDPDADSAPGVGTAVLMPATPPGDAQAPVTSTAPVTAANRAMCPDRMISTRVHYRESAFTFVTDVPVGHDHFGKVLVPPVPPVPVVALRPAGGSERGRAGSSRRSVGRPD